MKKWKLLMPYWVNIFSNFVYSGKFRDKDWKRLRVIYISPRDFKAPCLCALSPTYDKNRTFKVKRAKNISPRSTEIAVLHFSFKSLRYFLCSRFVYIRCNHQKNVEINDRVSLRTMLVLTSYLLKQYKSPFQRKKMIFWQSSNNNDV